MWVAIDNPPVNAMNRIFWVEVRGGVRGDLCPFRSRCLITVPVMMLALLVAG